jgi:hypothetical protein
MIKMDAVGSRGLQFDPLLFPAEDYGLWTELVFAGRAMNLPFVLSLEGASHFSALPGAKTQQSEAISKIRRTWLERIGMTPAHIGAWEAWLDISRPIPPGSLTSFALVAEAYCSYWKAQGPYYERAARAFTGFLVIWRLYKLGGANRLSLAAEFSRLLPWKAFTPALFHSVRGLLDPLFRKVP